MWPADLGSEQQSIANGEIRSSSERQIPTRGGFRGRGRGRGRGRSSGRGQSHQPPSVRDQAAVTEITDQPQQTSRLAHEAAAVNRSRDHSAGNPHRRPHGQGRGEVPVAGANPSDANSHRQPRLRGRGQPRQRANQQNSQRTGNANSDPAHSQQAPGQPVSACDTAACTVPGAPDCIVCCEPIQVLAIGRCNHRAVCERCSLRLVMLYQDTRCPLCKAELDQVVMTYWKEPEPSDWSEYAAKLDQLWHKPNWAKSIYVDNQPPVDVSQTRPLHTHLQQLSAKACRVCDRQAHRPFPSNAALAKHVREQHKQHLCHVCLEAHRAFPLELPVYKTQAALDVHVAEAHSVCKFCNINFFSGEELWEHIHNNHFTCQLCLRQGHHNHFAGPQELTDHLRQDHFLCTEEACQDCFIAFSSLRELQDHHRDFHSHRMPRWNPSRARHVALADVFPSLAPTSSRPTGPGGNPQNGRGRGRAQAQNRPRAAQGRGPDLTGQGNRAAPNRAGAPQDLVQAEGGLTMIDDDFPAMNGHTAGPLLANRANMHQPQQTEAFPVLQSASAGVTSGSEQDQPSQQRHKRHTKPLVKVTVKCPCKRQTSHQVVQEGQQPLPLHCNAACAQASRQQQLAGAFGVEDPAHHVSSFDKNRTASYSPLLLTHAWSNKAWVQGLEGQLAAFICAKGTKRQSLSAMPRHQREVVHAVAEQYGLASSSYKQEPHRYVELFKLPTSSIPNKLLSETVRGMTHEDIISCGRAAHGHPLHLTDLSQDVDVDWFLRQWDGQYNTEWQNHTEVVVRFTTVQALKEALTALGGGIRGVFRVDRGYGFAVPEASTMQPHAAAATSSSHQPSQARAAQTHSGSDWQTVKGSNSRPKGTRKADDRNGPTGARAAPAYASASPLDFQEPWRDEVSASGLGVRSRQAASKQVAMPALSEDDLPEDWEEAALDPDSPAATGATLHPGSPVATDSHSHHDAARDTVDSAQSDLATDSLIHDVITAAAVHGLGNDAVPSTGAVEGTQPAISDSLQHTAASSAPDQPGPDNFADGLDIESATTTAALSDLRAAAAQNHMQDDPAVDPGSVSQTDAVPTIDSRNRDHAALDDFPQASPARNPTATSDLHSSNQHDL